MFEASFLAKLTAILQRCIHRLEEASQEMSNPSQQPPSQRNAQDPTPGRRDQPPLLANNIMHSKINSENNGCDRECCKSDQEDLKMFMRRKLLRKRPKPPMNAFIAYVQAQKARISVQRPKSSIAEITAIASKQWKTLEPAAKSVYIQAYESRQQEYRRAQAAFIRANPEFRMLTKSIRSRAKKSHRRRDLLSKRSPEQKVQVKEEDAPIVDQLAINGSPIKRSESDGQAACFLQAGQKQDTPEIPIAKDEM